MFVSKHIFSAIIFIIYFENVHFFHATLGLDVWSYEVPPHIPEYCPFRIYTKHFHVIIHTLLPSHLFPPLHLASATVTSTFLQADTKSSTFPCSIAQTTSICHASRHPPHSVHPDDCTKPHYASYPSATPHISSSPSSVPSSPDFAGFAFFIAQVSALKCQYTLDTSFYLYRNSSILSQITLTKSTW